MRQRAVAPITMVVESLSLTGSLGLLQWVQQSLLDIAGDVTGGEIYRSVALIKLPRPPEPVLVHTLQTPTVTKRPPQLSKVRQFNRSPNRYRATGKG